MKRTLSKIATLVLLIAASCQYAAAQAPTTINSTGTTGGGTASTNNGYTFTVRNNNPIPIRITDISCYHYGGTTTYDMWYTTDPAQVAAGTPLTITPGPWTMYGTTAPISSPNGVKPYFTNIALQVPANTSMRICMAFPIGSPTVFTPNNTHTGGPIFSANGVDLMSGSNAISNGVWGYGSTNPPTLNQSPHNFVGSITFVPDAIPCDDTITSAIILAPDKVCPNRPFKASVGLPNGLLISGLSHQWQYSFDGFTWANYTGVPDQSGSIIDSTTKDKWYRCIITCAANSQVYTTPIKKVTIQPFYYCYCTNSVSDGEGMDLGNLSIMEGTKLDTVYAKDRLITGTGLPEYNNSAANKKYTSYHDSLAWPCLYRDTTYTFSISKMHSGGSFQGGFAQAYVDFNRDGIYDPATEKVGTQAYNGSAQKPNELRFSFSVPADTNKTKLGPTGLRLILSDAPVTGNPCDTISGQGEVEDYIVNMCNRPCSGPVDAGIVESTDTGMCNGYEYTLTDTTYSREVSAFSRAWQVSGDNISWNNITNSLNKDTLERVFDGQPLYYRLRTICLSTHDTAYSPATKINAKPSYKCYCYSKAIGGVSFDSSDIGGLSVGPFSKNEGGPHLMNQLAKYPRTDYTDKAPIELFTDSTYSFYVYHTMKVVEHGDAKVTIFMDFNNNHQYDIPEERVYTGFTAIGNHTLVDNITVPFKAITDLPTGMRVILNNDVGPNIPSDEACGGYISGETEDFILIFRKKWGVNVLNTSDFEGFSVHPNPSNGKFVVQFSTGSAIKDVNIRLTTVSGQLVKEQSYSHEGGMFYQSLDVTGQPAGVYFVELSADGKKMIDKLIIK